MRYVDPYMSGKVSVRRFDRYIGRIPLMPSSLPNSQVCCGSRSENSVSFTLKIDFVLQIPVWKLPELSRSSANTENLTVISMKMISHVFRSAVIFNQSFFPICIQNCIHSFISKYAQKIEFSDTSEKDFLGECAALFAAHHPNSVRFQYTYGTASEC